MGSGRSGAKSEKKLIKLTAPGDINFSKGGLMMAKKDKKKEKERVGQNEDVEYSRELADAEDRQAQKRAEAADRRAKRKK